MRLIYIIIAACLLLQVSCTRKQPMEQGTGQSMLMDSLYMEDKQVTVVTKDEKAVLSEEMKNLEDNPNISQADLDAMNRLEAKNIRYIQKGDKIILSEKE